MFQKLSDAFRHARRVAKTRQSCARYWQPAPMSWAVRAEPYVMSAIGIVMGLILALFLIQMGKL